MRLFEGGPRWLWGMSEIGDNNTDLAEGELGEEVGALVGLAELELALGRDCDLGTGVLGRDERLVRTEVLGVRVQSLEGRRGLIEWVLRCTAWVFH